MMKRSSKYYLLRGLVVLVLGLMFLISYAVTKTLTEKEEEPELRYVSYEILTDNVMPVISEQENTNTIMRPYTADKIIYKICN